MHGVVNFCLLLQTILLKLVVKLGIPYDTLLATLSRDPKTWPYDNVTSVYLLLWRRKLAFGGNRTNWRLRESVPRNIPAIVPSSMGALENGGNLPNDYQDANFSAQGHPANIAHAASNDAISPRPVDCIRKPLPISTNMLDHVVDDVEHFDSSNAWFSESSVSGKENVNPMPSSHQFSPTLPFSGKFRIHYL